ncbi:hypothetical protein KR100_01205 [Synechococcus sp. KORDI-100]|nr:hypothetical protein KR100_01205 [Synechococcus sp. KORDI-100]
MAMLGLLQDLKRLHFWKLLVWHGDHAWHTGSAAIAAQLKEWCDSQQHPIDISRASDWRKHSENAAREWRYEELQKRAISYQCDVVMGHTASDRAETVMLQMARGCDLSGLGSLRPKRPLDRSHPDGPQLRRPMLSFSRTETREICNELDLPIWLDPSNESIAFARNRIRKDVLPVLENLYPGSSRRMANMAERMSHVQDTQNELADIALETLTEVDGLDRRRLSSLSDATRQAVIHHWIQTSGVPTTSAVLIAQLSHRLRFGSAAGTKALPGDWILQWDNKIVRLRCQSSGL